jgi:hypothetical protein
LRSGWAAAVRAAAENVASSQLSKGGAAAERQDILTTFQSALHATAAVNAATNLAAVCVLAICPIKQAR